MTMDRHGRAFIGIFGLATGALVRLDPDGTVEVAAEGMLLPNGQALSADGRTLIVAESAGQRLTAFTVEVDGSLVDGGRSGAADLPRRAPRREWARLGEPATATTLPGVLEQVSVWPDGIVLEPAGAAWVADPLGKQAMRVVEGGEVTHRIPTGELACYACAVGGPDGDTLFLCAAPPGLGETTRRTTRGARILARRIGARPAENPRDSESVCALSTLRASVVAHPCDHAARMARRVLSQLAFVDVHQCAGAPGPVAEAQAFVEPPSRDIGLVHADVHGVGAAGASLSQCRLHQRPAESLAPPRRHHVQLGQVTLRSRTPDR